MRIRIKFKFKDKMISQKFVRIAIDLERQIKIVATKHRGPTFSVKMIIESRLSKLRMNRLGLKVETSKTMKTA